LKILSLNVKNFLSYYDETIDFAALDYASISGKNGSGKSSIPDAIAWALYGSLRVAGDADSVVNDNANEAIVTLVTGDAERNPQWQIIRRRNSKSGTGKLTLNYFEDGVWKGFGDQSSKTAQTQINEIVGLDKDAFYSLVVMESSAGTRFTQAKGTERRDILLSLVPELNHWSGREKVIKDNLDVVLPELTKLESSIERYDEMRNSALERIETMQEELEEIGEPEDIAKLELKIEKATQALAAASSGKAAIIAEYDAAKDKHQSRVEQMNAKADKLGDKLVEVKKHRIRYSRVAEKLSERKGELEDKMSDLSELESDAEDFDTSIAHTEKEIARLKNKLADQQSKLTLAKQLEEESNERIGLLEESESGQCYVCHTKLTEDKVNDLISGAKSDVKRGKHEHHEAQQEIDNIQDKIDTLEGKLRKKRSEAEGHRTKVARLESSIDSLKDAVREAQNDLDAEAEDLPSESEQEKLQHELDRLEDDIEDLEDEWEKKTEPAFERRIAASESEEVDRLSGKLADLKDERQDAQRQQAKITSIQGAINEVKTNVSELDKKSKKTRLELAEKTQRVEDMKFLLAAFAPRGIPSMLLDSILGEIEDKQNEILTTLPGMENTQVEFRQSRENKKGTGARDTLDIIVHTGTGNERRFESFSAGEKVKLTISNLFAMIAVFNERHPGMIDTLFLDEPLGVLDTGSVPAFVEVLRVIMGAGIVSSIFVIAHDDRVIESLPQRLVVSQTDSAGSKIMVMS
jgi:exonuclease SbcC